MIIKFLTKNKRLYKIKMWRKVYFNLQEKRTLKTKYFAKVLYKIKRKVLLIAKKNRNSKRKKN